MKCIFPFKMKLRSTSSAAKTFNTCTHEKSPTGAPWCATKVDDNGVYIRGNWGNCGEMCPIEDGCNCIFPFTHQGITHNACTMHNPPSRKYKYPWCATKVTTKGIYIGGYTASCSKECPFEKGKILIILF